MFDFLKQLPDKEWFGPVFSKLTISFLILIAAYILARLSEKALNRWQRRVIRKLEQKNPASITAVETRQTVIRRVVVLLIYFIALTFIFLQFKTLRNIGTGLLASAGVAGIVIGMAARNTLADMVAGIAISFSQPVRLNDAVIFEGDFGWIESIAFMHTTIKTWDNRRIIVPNSVLMHKVIQNWTIKDPSLLGIVMMYVDYTCDVEKLRGWVRDIVEKSEHASDEKVAVVQVVDFTERTMVVRILAKGPNAPSTWALRCEVREKLIRKFKEENLPLPKIRLEGNISDKPQD